MTTPRTRPRAKLAVAVAALSLTAVACPFGPKELGVVVQDAEGFHRGDPVLLQGVPIGEVTEITLEDGHAVLLARLESAHRDALREGAVVRLRRPGLLGGGTALRAVIVEDPGVGAPLPAGARVRAAGAGELLMKDVGAALGRAAEVVEGAAGEVGLALDRALDGVADGAQGAGMDAAEAVRGAADTARVDGDRLLNEARQLAEAARAQGADALERLRRESMPKLEEDLQDLEDALRKGGDPDAAEDLRREFQRIFK